MLSIGLTFAAPSPMPDPKGPASGTVGQASQSCGNSISQSSLHCCTQNGNAGSDKSHSSKKTVKVDSNAYDMQCSAIAGTWIPDCRALRSSLQSNSTDFFQYQGTSPRPSPASAPLQLPAATAMGALLSPTSLYLDTGAKLPRMWKKWEHGSIEVESINTVEVSAHCMMGCKARTFFVV